jgi:drug/metabolite transporter (DMT)-like permease
LKEKSGRWVTLGLLVATVGAALVALGAGTAGKELNTLGITTGVLSGIMSGAATTSLRGVRQSTDAFTVFFAFCAFGLAFTAPLAAFRWVPLDGHVWLLVLAVALVSLIGQLLYTYALGYTKTVTAGVTNQLAPVFSFGMAVVFLGDHPKAVTLAGAALCVTGVLLGLERGRV